MARTWCFVGALLGVNLTAVAMAQPQLTRQAAATPLPSPGERSIDGPARLKELLTAHDDLSAQAKRLEDDSSRLYADGYEKHKETLLEAERTLEALRQKLSELETEIDQVGRQRGCAVSRLYWHTDLNEAKAESARRGRPILSLRMLGRLTDEYSCANSRFFRTALYSNREISDFLRTNFVLHWQSVRPVPRVTIDFGDGRKLERTLTGNSAHYVLASDGTPLDVLPGLYSPLAFRQWLWHVSHFYAGYEQASAADRTSRVAAYHRDRLAETLRRWDADIQQLGAPHSDLVAGRIQSSIELARLAGKAVPDAGVAPPAARAARAAVGKTVAEAPLLRLAHLGGSWMERGMDDEVWQAIAALRREDVKLDGASVAVMRREFPRAAAAGRLSVVKSDGENPVLRMVRAFENSMALDTVRNEYLLHRRVHEKFINDAAPPTDVDALNEWVYAELFLTPSSDPWLGLAPNDVYTALDGDGRTEPPAPPRKAGG